MKASQFTLFTSFHSPIHPFKTIAISELWLRVKRVKSFLQTLKSREITYKERERVSQLALHSFHSHDLSD